MKLTVESLPEVTAPEGRALYARVRNMAPMPSAKFNSVVSAILDGKVRGGHEAATPRQWVKAALLVESGCYKCEGSGRYKGPVSDGECYACNGKGYQHYADWCRNSVYWRYRAGA
jgi:hypothetical protein